MSDNSFLPRATSDSNIPFGTIPSQPLTTTALDGYPSCLVDDPVYLVDDSRILVGSQTQSMPDARTGSRSTTPVTTGNTYSSNGNSDNNAPKSTITIRH